MPSLETRIELLRGQIMEGGVLDPVGTHHEFVSGMHGQKLDFDTIETGSPLYQAWVEVNYQFLQESVEKLPELILGVANGTNRLAIDVAKRYSPIVMPGFESEKDADNSKKLRLTKAARHIIKYTSPDLVVVLEDVGTTGSNSVQVAVDALDAGAGSVLVIPTWQRRPNLERLDEAGVPYRAIINEPLTTYSPEDCQSLAEGFCNQGWEFIPREN